MNQWYALIRASLNKKYIKTRLDFGVFFFSFFLSFFIIFFFLQNMVSLNLQCPKLGWNTMCSPGCLWAGGSVPTSTSQVLDYKHEPLSGQGSVPSDALTTGSQEPNSMSKSAKWVFLVLSRIQTTWLLRCGCTFSPTTAVGLTLVLRPCLWSLHLQPREPDVANV